MVTEEIKETLDPERIYLFGSYARDEETETSDYDFYVVVDEGKGNPLLLCDKAYSAIFDIQEKPCDVIVNHKSKFDIRKYRPTLEKTVVKEGVLLYEKRS